MSKKNPRRPPKVSVLMTIYNAAQHLKEAIDSIVAQTFGDWELIAIENGSSDASPAILAGYQDERIRIFPLPANIGRTPALRYAFDQARGEYTAVLDADDVSFPERLKKQAEYLDKYCEVGLVGSWAEQINVKGKVIGHLQPPTIEKELYEMLGWSNPFVHSSIMYRSGNAKKIGGYPAAYIHAQDCALILAIAKQKNARLCMIGEYLCKYRITGTSMTRNPDMLLSIGQEELALLREAAEIFPLSKFAAERNHHRQAVAQLKIGVALVKGANVVDGLKRIAAAIIENPRAATDNGIVNRIFSSNGRSKWL